MYLTANWQGIPVEFWASQADLYRDNATVDVIFLAFFETGNGGFQRDVPLSELDNLVNTDYPRRTI